MGSAQTCIELSLLIFRKLPITYLSYCIPNLCLVNSSNVRVICSVNNNITFLIRSKSWLLNSLNDSMTLTYFPFATSQRNCKEQRSKTILLSRFSVLSKAMSVQYTLRTSICLTYTRIGNTSMYTEHICMPAFCASASQYYTCTRIRVLCFIGWGRPIHLSKICLFTLTQLNSCSVQNMTINSAYSAVDASFIYVLYKYIWYHFWRHKNA